MSIWTYTNVSTKQGLTDGEFMFDFALHELGVDENMEKEVRTVLSTLFNHNLNSTKLELVFLTLQEFQYLTIMFGDFFKSNYTTITPLPTGFRALPPGMPEARKTAFEHFCGISAGVSGLDNMNAVRVANMARSFDGSRIAILKLGVWERASLYFNHTMKKYKKGNPASLVYRNVAIGDTIVLLKREFGGDAAQNANEDSKKLELNLRNENPSIHFVMDKRTLPVLNYTIRSCYYFLATVCEPALSQLMKWATISSTAVHRIGFIAAVHKSNPNNPLPKGSVVDTQRYHQISSPAMQESRYSVVLTNLFEHGNQDKPVLWRLTIGAPLPTPQESISTGPIKRTAADASLSISASATASKLNRKSSSAIANASSTINPAS